MLEPEALYTCAWDGRGVREDVTESAARTRIKGVGLEHRKVMVHRSAAARCFLDDDACRGPERCDLLQQVAVGQAVGRHPRCPPGGWGWGWGWGPGGSVRCEQRADAESKVRDDRQ